MNKEKKILAISEGDFDDIIVSAIITQAVNSDILTKQFMGTHSKQLSNIMGPIIANIHFLLFSDVYVIGTKGKTAEADKL